MQPVIRFLLLALACVPAAHAQSDPRPAHPLVPADRPPSSVDNSVPTPPVTTAIIPAGLRQAADRAHASWKRDDGGQEFQAGLSYAGDKPILMLVTAKHEPAELMLRRQKAIISACEFLLDDAAFDRTWICVVDYDHRKPAEQAARNYEISRTLFQSAAKQAAKQDNVKDAVKQSRTDAAVARQICAALGVK